MPMMPFIGVRISWLMLARELALGPGGCLSSVPGRGFSGIQRRIPKSDRGLRRKAFEEALIFWGEMEWLATG